MPYKSGLQKFLGKTRKGKELNFSIYPTGEQEQFGFIGI